MGGVRPRPAPQRNRSESLRGECRQLWRRECAVQRLCALAAFRHDRDSSDRAHDCASSEFLFDPNFLFGKNVPQTLYTWSWDGIGIYKWGVGIDLPKRFEFRFTQHPNIVRFGSRDQPLGHWRPNGLRGHTTPSASGDLRYAARWDRLRPAVVFGVRLPASRGRHGVAGASYSKLIVLPVPLW